MFVKPTVRVSPDTRHEAKGSTETVKVYVLKIVVAFQVTRNGKKRSAEDWYPILDGGQKIIITEAHAAKVIAGKNLRTDDDKRLAELITAAKQKASDIIKTDFITRELFDKAWKGNQIVEKAGAKTDLFALLRYVQEEKRNNAQRTAVGHINAIIKHTKAWMAEHPVYKGREDISLFEFSNKDTKDLAEYWGTKVIVDEEPLKVNTIKAYMCNLRAAIRQAIDVEEWIPESCYPFNTKKGAYKFREEPADKRALDPVERELVMNYKPINEKEEKALGFWKLSYYWGGMNFTDILLLKKNGLQGKRFAFSRKKNIGKPDQPKIVIAMQEEAYELMNLMLLKYPSSSVFLFGVLKDGMSKAQMQNRTNRFVRENNEITKAIGRKLGINLDLTTYVARHTMATTLLEQGGNIVQISKVLGHKSLAMTERYLSVLTWGDECEKVLEKLANKKEAPKPLDDAKKVLMTLSKEDKKQLLKLLRAA